MSRHVLAFAVLITLQGGCSTCGDYVEPLPPAPPGVGDECSEDDDTCREGQRCVLGGDPLRDPQSGEYCEIECSEDADCEEYDFPCGEGGRCENGTCRRLCFGHCA